MDNARKHRILTRAEFLLRWQPHVLFSLGLVVISLAIGIAGYVYFEHLSLLDAFLNASMLLGGMGPIALPQTVGGKLFAGFYALYAGLIFLVAVGFVLAPVLHRMLLRFHVEGDDKSSADG
ncbi:MAG: hypothetical protein ABI882_11360 [Acidobacteriota bacterium]